MSELVLQLENSADEALMIELLKRMGIKFTAFKQSLNSKKMISQHDSSYFQMASESVLNGIWDNEDDAEYDKL